MQKTSKQLKKIPNANCDNHSSMTSWIIKQEQENNKDTWYRKKKTCGLKYKGDVPGENGIVSSWIQNKVDRETFPDFYAYNKVLLKNAELIYNFFKNLYQNMIVAWLLLFIEYYSFWYLFICVVGFFLIHWVIN